MFSVAHRDRVRDRVLEMAALDKRVTAGAVVGSLALGEGDRWSDLDLTFGIVESTRVLDVLEDWTASIRREFNAAVLFDLPSGPSIYRVFLLPGCLQLDLSFTPATRFGSTGPKFRLIFGSAIERAPAPSPSAEELFGHAVHHVVRACFCIERGRFWQAEYWISAARDNALSLACLSRGLPAAHGRGYDSLPPAVPAGLQMGLVHSLEPEELKRALRVVIDGLLGEAVDAQQLESQIEPWLRELAQS